MTDYEIAALESENELLRAAYSAARLEIESQQTRISQLEREKRQAAFAIEVLEKDVKCLSQQLESIGAGGVEPLRKPKCLHQIQEPHDVVVESPRWLTVR